MRSANFHGNELERLSELKKYNILDTNTELVFENIVELIAKIYHVPIVAIALVDEHRVWLKASIGLDFPEMARDGSFCDLTISQDEPTIINNTLHDDRFKNNKLVISKPAVRFYAGVPLQSSNGYHLGTLFVMDTKSRHIDKEQLDALKIFATTVMAHIELRLTHRQIRKFTDDSRLSGSIFESASESIIVTDAFNKIISVNPAFCATTGYTQEEVIGKNPSILSSGKQGAKFYQDMWNTLNNEGHWDGELWNRRKNGEEYTEWLSINIIYNDDGSKRMYLAIFSDVTEQENTKIRLQQLLIEQEAILNTKTTGFMHLKDRHFQWTNETFESMLGYESGELQGKSTRVIYSNDDEYKKYETTAHENLLAKGTFTGEFKCVKKNGETIWLIISITTIKDKPDESMAVAVDITNQKSLEDRLGRKKEEFETIFKSSIDGIAIVDLETIFLEFNDAFLSITGLEREELLTKSCIELGTKEDAIKTTEALKEVIKVGFIKNFEKKCKLKDEIITINISFTLLPDKKRMLMIAKDVTEKIALEDKLRCKNENLQETVSKEIGKRLEQERLLVQQSKMAMMGEMIGAIAHQWRQPLNSLGLIIQEIHLAYQLGEMDDLHMDSFKSSAIEKVNAMSRTIEDFRNFFSPNKKTEEFYVEDAIKESLVMLDSQLKVHCIDVIFDTNNTNKHSCICHKNELKHIVINILANAKDALSEKKPEISFIKIDVNSNTHNGIDISSFRAKRL